MEGIIVLLHSVEMITFW